MKVYSIISKLDNKQFLFFNSNDCIYFLKLVHNIKTESCDLIDVENIIVNEINITGRQIIYGVYCYETNSYHGYYNTELKALDELNNKITYLKNKNAFIDNNKVMLKNNIKYIIHPIIIQ